MIPFSNPIFLHLLCLFILVISPISFATYLVLFILNCLWTFANSPELWIKSHHSFGPLLIEKCKDYCTFLVLLFLLGDTCYKNLFESFYLASHFMFRFPFLPSLLTVPSTPSMLMIKQKKKFLPLFMIWASPILLLLDWNQPWQTYPYPMIVACEVGCFFTSLFFSHDVSKD